MDQKFFIDPMMSMLAGLDGFDPMSMFYLRIPELVDITANKPLYFENMGFGTTNLDRDLSRNLALTKQKMLGGYKRPVGILRFEWELVEIAHSHERVNASE